MYFKTRTAVLLLILIALTQPAKAGQNNLNYPGQQNPKSPTQGIYIYYNDFVHLERETLCNPSLDWNQNTYNTFRQNLLDLASYISDHNLTLDVGVDLVWIWADEKWSDGTLYATLDSMNGIDVLPHCHNSLSFVWDGVTYYANEADTAYALKQIGVKPYGVVSGGA